jgi:hypothetical protein
MKNEKFLTDGDIKTLRLVQANATTSIDQNGLSASYYAGSANTYAGWITSDPAISTSGTLTAYDPRGITPTNISITGMFQQVASFFFGRTDSLIPRSENTNLSTRTAKFIFVNRPNLDQGLKEGSITANISCGGTAMLNSINIYDIPLTASTDDMKLGSMGQLVVSGNSNDIVGSVFYDYGLILFHGGMGSATANMFITNTKENYGLYFGSASGCSTSSVTAQVNINQLYYRTKKYIVRNYYFCRVLNDEFNYTSNPTSKKSNGELIDNLVEVPSAYITTVGLFNNNDECLAVAKVSPPIRKHSGQEYIFKVTLDFAWLLMAAPFVYSVFHYIGGMFC